MLLVPPLLHPTSPDPPLGVVALTCTGPGPEITPVVSVTFSCWLLGTDAASVLPLMTNSVDETNWLPFTVSTTPCSTCVNVTLLGDSDPIAGTGRALPQRGFKVLLQPGRTINSSAKGRPLLRDSIPSSLRRVCPPGLVPFCSLQPHRATDSSSALSNTGRIRKFRSLPKSPPPVAFYIIFFAIRGSFRLTADARSATLAHTSERKHCVKRGHQLPSQTTSNRNAFVSSDFISDPEPLQRLLASAFVVQESGIGARLLASIAEVQQQIELGDLTLDEATQRIAQRALCVADASGTAVALLKADQLVYNAGSGSAASYVGRKVMATLTASATPQAPAEILRVEDADADGRIQAAICRQYGAKSLLILPVHCDRQLSGVLQIFFDQPHHFTDPEVRVYQLLAGLVEDAMLAHIRSEQEIASLPSPLGAFIEPEPLGAPQSLASESAEFPLSPDTALIPEPSTIDDPREIAEPALVAEPIAESAEPEEIVDYKHPIEPEEIVEPDPILHPLAHQPAFFAPPGVLPTQHESQGTLPAWARPENLTIFRRACDAAVAAIALIAVISFLIFQGRSTMSVPPASSASAKSVSADHPLAATPDTQRPQPAPAATSSERALAGTHFVSASPKHPSRSSASYVEHLGDDVTIRYFPPKPTALPAAKTEVRRISDDVTVRYFNSPAPSEPQTR